MTAIVCDASVVVKWFHTRDEEEVAESRAILKAHTDGAVQARVLDLTHYEVGNVLIRSLRWPGDKAARLLRRIDEICGESVALTADTRTSAAKLAAKHGLSFYDAAYWAVAQDLDAHLASADEALVRAGGALTPAALCTKLELEPDGD